MMNMDKDPTMQEEQERTPAPPSEEAGPRKVNELVDELGKITFTEQVLSALVHQAVSEIEGLGEVKGKITDIVSVFGGRQKGVQVELQPDGIKVTMNITVRYGKPIHEVARQIQRRIKEEVENMTGLTVAGVDIYVQDIQPPEEPTPADEEAIPEASEGI